MYTSVITQALLCMEQGIEFDEDRAAVEEQHGAPKNSAGRWASCVRVLDPTSLQTSRCGSRSAWLSDETESYGFT